MTGKDFERGEKKIFSKIKRQIGKMREPAKQGGLEKLVNNLSPIFRHLKYLKKAEE
jgi:hypothetical protein